MESQVEESYSLGTNDFFPSGGNDTFTCSHPISLGYASNHQNAEFKIPFLSNRTATLCRNNFDGPDTVISGFNRENYDNQSIVIAVYLEGIPPTEAARASHDFNFIYELDVAFADEASFGVWIGHPDAYIQVQEEDPLKAVGPDQWIFDALTQTTNVRKTQRTLPSHR
jgi:hypothetical protein